MRVWIYSLVLCGGGRLGRNRFFDAFWVTAFNRICRPVCGWQMRLYRGTGDAAVLDAACIQLATNPPSATGTDAAQL